MVRPVKREPGNTSRGHRVADVDESGTSDFVNQLASDRRVLRSRYLAVKTTIIGERDDIARCDSDKFESIFDEVETLHQQVQKPREQVADAEALLDITMTLVTSVKAQNNEGITLSDFVTCVLRDFGQNGGPSTSASTDGGRNMVAWKDIGIAVSHAFRSCPGCCTMIGPMNLEVKERKAVVQRKRVKPTNSVRPEELNDTATEEKTDTDKNMATMFNILRKNRRVRLEKLVLNRNSFAQTVENLFALSFLVKDGRVEIKVDDQGCHLVSPRNAPPANSVVSGEVAYRHFVFRFDFKDWKLMTHSVGIGEELMPDRKEVDLSDSEQVPVFGESEGTAPTTPIRKLSRNRGLVLQEQTVVQDSPESENIETRGAAVRRGKKRKVR
ncbi:Nse4 domain-containing protein [Cephalotus follicularis]|uniref:Non-structural maintenance of chromosomes element 4 n=1 Tax=Cephalotus follicularis TaxID=3775 RepID=A0A1Q3B7L4_CEPFO|nr:Nse4 domain-containing protein [Cephalotus follicularis]